MTLTKGELLAAITDDPPEPGELVYVERRGDGYVMRRNDVGVVTAGPPEDAPLPDAWIFYSGRWPSSPDEAPAFLDDLLAEMEAGAGAGGNRCRWAADDPYPWPQH